MFFCKWRWRAHAPDSWDQIHSSCQEPSCRMHGTWRHPICRSHKWLWMLCQHSTCTHLERRWQSSCKCLTNYSISEWRQELIFYTCLSGMNHLGCSRSWSENWAWSRMAALQMERFDPSWVLCSDSGRLMCSISGASRAYVRTDHYWNWKPGTRAHFLMQMDLENNLGLQLVPFSASMQQVQ